MRKLSRPAALTLGLTLAAGAAPAQDALSVIGTVPAGRALAVPADSPIRVRFDRPVFGASVTPATFWAFGRWSGPVSGRIEESFDGLEVTLLPERPFSAGEQVTVFLSRDLMAGDGTTLRAAGYSFQFWVRSRGAGFDFFEDDRLSTRTVPGVSSRAYGGLGSDLDGDGHLDLTIVNEDTDDLRVFLNRGDRSGRLRRFLRPPARVGAVPSPSEPSDFDRDGRVDVAVANTRDRTVSILLGNGDGTFALARHYEVGAEPRGLAVLDADGDGDVDVAATSFGESHVTVLLNDGEGGFEETRVFGSGSGARALAAGDMDGDGVLDLVVGDLLAGEVRVYAGAGDGVFEPRAIRAVGGRVWMLVLGDVDGDGAEDVAAVNSETNNAAILLGDGAGGLATARMIPTDEFPLATDLADLDGDGDLDWMTSSFFGDWQLFENEGGGSFRLARTFAAPQAASCSVAMDLDGDGILDLALIDELADEVVLLHNRPAIFSADFESGGLSGWSRSRGAVSVVSPGLGGSGGALEVEVGGAAAFVETRRPRRESKVVVELTLDAGDVDLAGGDVEVLRLGGGRGVVLLRLEERGTGYRLRALARERGGIRDLGSVRLRSAGARLRLEWSSATEPGRRNGRVILSAAAGSAGATDLDNHGRTVGRARVGTGGGGAASGRFLVDDVVIRR